MFINKYYEISSIPVIQLSTPDYSHVTKSSPMKIDQQTQL